MTEQEYDIKAKELNDAYCRMEDEMADAYIKATKELERVVLCTKCEDIHEFVNYLEDSLEDVKCNIESARQSLEDNKDFVLKLEKMIPEIRKRVMNGITTDGKNT